VVISEQEFEKLLDTEFLLTKRSITQKITDILGATERAINHEIEQLDNLTLPDGLLLRAGKISKGENYRDLPYFVLDYPRKFTRDDVFAFRILIRWGHEISTIFQLSGNSQSNYFNPLSTHYDLLKSRYLSIGSDPWKYEYSSDNYQLISNLATEKYISLIQNHPFIKFTKPHALKDINNLVQIGQDEFRFYMSLLH
jgi:hypothetical protein